MRARVRENAVVAVTAALVLYIVGWLALYGWAWSDYDDEVRPALDALVGGHILHFLQLAPAYGGSLILRAPFVLIPSLWGGGELSIYRAAAVPCLLASGFLGVWLVAHMRELGRSRGARALALLLCVANPITLRALEYGHPEELLGAVLCVAAVLAAINDRPLWAGVLLGLAVANKEWAVLAAGPVLLALPRQRMRAMCAAGAVALLVLSPLLLGGSNGLTAQADLRAARSSVIFQPWQVWWFFGSHGHVVTGLFGAVKVGYRTPPGWIETFSHPLIAALGLPLTLLCVWRRRRAGSRPAADALLLLLLLLLLRFVLDPWDNAYYPLPFLIALVVWESVTFDRAPVRALAGSFATWFVFQGTTAPVFGLSADAQSLVFLAFAIPAVIATAVALYSPQLSQRLPGALRRRPPLPNPA